MHIAHESRLFSDIGLKLLSPLESLRFIDRLVRQLRYLIIFLKLPNVVNPFQTHRCVSINHALVRMA